MAANARSRCCQRSPYMHVHTYRSRHIAENIGETINWRRVCVRNETDRQIGYTRAFSRIQERTRSLHIVIKFRIDGCQLVQSFFNWFPSNRYSPPFSLPPCAFVSVSDQLPPLHSISLSIGKNAGDDRREDDSKKWTSGEISRFVRLIDGRSSLNYSLRHLFNYERRKV